jgi:hypothetical protein
MVLIIYILKLNLLGTAMAFLPLLASSGVPFHVSLQSLIILAKAEVVASKVIIRNRAIFGDAK